MKTTRNSSAGKRRIIAPSGIVLFILILFGIIIGQKTSGQGVGISESSITPDTWAILELRSNLRGFLAPRMTTADRTTLGSKPPSAGMLVYDTDTKSFWYWDGGWKAIAATALGTANQLLGMNGSGTANEYKTLYGTANQINVDLTTGGQITLSTPQNIHSGATPTFAGLTLSGLTANSGVYTDAAKALTSTPPTSGILGYWNRSGNILSPTTAGDWVTTTGNIYTTGSGTITSAGLLTGSSGITVTGAANLSGGVINLNNNSGFATNINTGTSAGSVTIGNSLNTITLPGLNSLGVVHTSAAGVLSTSLIVNNDITNNTIDLTTKVTGVLKIVNGGTGTSTAPTQGGIIFGSGPTTYGSTAAGSTGQVLQSNGSGTPTWSIPTYPSASGAAGKILRSDGTNNIYSTSTFADTYAASSILYSNGANNVQGLAAVDGGILNIAAGVPTITITPTIGVINSTKGTLSLTGNTSGIVTIQPQSAAGTYNFNLPTGAGTDGQPLLSGGGLAAPMTFGTLGVAGGGTSLTTFGGVNTILYTSAADLLTSVSTSTGAGQFLQTTTTGGAPTWKSILDVVNGGTGQSSYLNGELLIGNTTGNTLTKTTLTGTTNQVNVTNGNGSITLSTPQNIHTGATPTFAGLTLSGLTANSGVYTDGTSTLTSTPPTTGILGYWSRLGTVLSPTTAGDAVTTSGDISTTGTGTITSAGLLTGSSGATVTGATTISGGVIDLNSSSNNATNINTGTSTGGVTIGNSSNSITLPAFTTAGLVHNNATGVLSTGLLVNSDITAGTIDLTTKVTGVLPISNGGTNSGTALTNNKIIVSSAGQIVEGTAGTTTTVLHGNAAGLPTYGQIVNADIANGTIDLTSKVTGTLPVLNGGTGLTTFGGVNTILYTSAADLLTSVSTSTGAGQFLQTTTTGGAPTWKSILDVVNGGTGQSSYLNGELLIGNTTGNTLTKTTLTGTTNQVNVTNGNGSITLSTPQNIHTGATPTFAGLTLSGLTANSGVYTDGTSTLTSTPPTTGILGYWSRLGTVLSPTTAGDAVTTSGDISTTGTGTITSAGLLTGSSGATVTGATTISGGVIDLNSSSNNATNINTGTSTGGVTIGNSSNSITLPAFTTAGLVHNNATGVLSTGLLVNSDITAGTIDLTTKVTGVLPIANGGTNSGTALTNNKIIVSSAGQIVEGTAGTTTTVLHGNAAGLPTYGQIVNADIANGTIDLTSKVTGTLPVLNGGTGLTTFGGVNTILYTSAADLLTSVSTSTGAGQFLQTTTTGGAPTWKSILDVVNGGTGQSSYLNGELLIGNTTGNTLTKATLTGTTNQVNVTNGNGSITLSTPQNIHTGATPTFAGLTLSGLTANSGVYTDGTSTLTSTPPTTGILGYWSRLGTVLSPTTAGDAVTTSGDISTTGTGTITSAGLLTGSSGATVTGATTISGGVIDLNSSSNNATNINTGTSTGGVTIGNSSNSITLPAFTTAGLVHNNATGVLSTGLLVNSDITAGTIDLTTKVTGVLPISNGGTNSGTALTNNKIIVSSAGQIVEGTAGTTTTVLHGNAAGLPTYGQIVNADIANGTIDLTSKVTGTLPVLNGGTGLTTFGGVNTILYTSAADLLTSVSTSTGAGQFLQTTTTGGAPTWKSILDVVNGGTGQSSYLNGELLIGNTTGNTLTKATLTGTTNQVNVTNGNGSITLSTPQNIHTGATPTFAGLTLSGLTANSGVYTDGTSTLTSTPPTTGILGYWSRLGTVLSPTTAGDAVTTSGDISTTGTGTITSAGLLTGSSGATVTGATTISGGVIDLNSSSNNATNINTGTSTGGVTIGNSSNSITLPAFTTAGLVHNNATGVLSTGLLVNSDITAGTIDLTTKVTGVLPIANGGTNSGTALTNNKIIVSSAGQIVEGTAGTTTTVLHGNAAGLPTYGQIVNADIANGTIDLTSKVTGTLPVLNGGTGLTTFGGVNTILYTSAADLLTSVSTSTGAGQFLQTTTTGGAPTWKSILDVVNGGTGQSSYLNGELLIGNTTGNTLTKTTLTGTTNQVNVTNGNGSITLSTPQNIHTGATPTFAGLTLSGLTANSGVYTDGTSTLTSTPPTTGILGYWSRLGTVLSPTTAGDAVTTSGDISTTGTGTITSAGLLTGSSGATVTGATTISGGVIDLNSSSNNATNINTGTSTGGVTIGNSSNSITLPAFTTAGLVHNNATGVLSTGLLVNSDITAGTIDLTTKVTGVLPISNGGTNSGTALTNNKIIVSSAGQIVEAGALSDGQIIVGKTGFAPQLVTMGTDATISNTGALTISPNAVSYAKMQNVTATSKLLGSSSTTTPVQEISLGSGLSMTGTTLTATGLGGTVTNFSAGDLSPLFTTSVLNPTTTPALSFSLTNAGAYTLFGNPTGASAFPSYFSPILASALFQNQGTLNSVLHGDATGIPSWSQIVNGDISNATIDLTAKVTGVLPGANGGTGVNNGSNTITLGGNINTTGDFTTAGAFSTTLTATAATSVTLPTSGTLYGTQTGSVTSAELATTLTDETGTGAVVFANTPTLVAPVLGVATATSVNGLIPTSQPTGFTISGGTISKTLTVLDNATISGSMSGNNTGDVTLSGENYLSLTGQALTANAVDLSGTNATGILAAGRFPALTGDVTTVAGALATTISNNAVTTAKILNSNVTYAKIQDISATDKVLGRVSAGAGVVEEISTTGSGNVVRATSPTLVTPDLGVATATSINSTTIPASKTLVVTTDKLNVLSSTTSAELAGVISDETGTGSLVFANTPTLVTPVLGAATGTSLSLGGGTALTTTNQTGTGNLVLATTPTLVTPVLGVATATSINGLIPTSQPTGFTISGGTISKTLTVLDNATISGSMSGNNTGDVTLSGENYLSLAGQALTANAVDLSGTNATGILAAGRFPALTGDVTTVAGALATTISNNAVTTAKILNSNVTYAKIQDISATDKVLGRVSAGAGVVEEISTTGSGNVVRATSPTLVTPDLGVATATSINSTTIPASKTLVVTTDKLNVLSSTTSAELAGVISDETGTGSLVFANTPTLVTPVLGAATGTSLSLGGGTALTTTNQTGTGNLVLATTPTLVTPVLGVATATSINGLIPTSQPTGFTISGGTISKTLTVLDNATISGSMSGNNTGDVTLSGENYLSLTGQALTANAVDLSGTNATGILAAGRFPALTGDVTTVAGALATTISNNAVTTAKILNSNVTYAKIQDISATDKVLGRVSAGAGVVEEISTTGSGNVVRATSPTLVTPDLGVATATSINSTTIPASKTLVVTTDKLNVLSSTTSAELAGVISDETGTGSLVFANTPTLVTPVLGAATGTSLSLGGGTALTTTNQTGTGNLVLATTPTLVTPVLGVATATSINGLIPTSQPTGFTISGGTISKTLTVLDNATISGSMSGNNTGDVTLSGENYLSLAGQALTANAVDLSGTNATGILAAGRFPALTGDVTTVAGALATTISNNAVTTAKILNSNVTYAKIQDISATDKVLGRVSAGAGVVEEISTTGSGNVVRATSPTLVTPDLGVATATSINSTTIPASKTLVVTTDKLNVLSSTTSAELAGVISDETGTGSLVFANTPTLVTPVLGAATGTSLSLGGGTALTTTNQTGTGNLVLATTPTLVTPVLGVATATSINGLIPTSQPTGFTISGGTISKTLTVLDNATISGSMSGNNTGDVTLSGENYLSLAGQALTANAVDLSGTNATGILAAGRFPALTGDVTTVAGALATTISNNAVTTAKILNSNVTYAKIQDISATDKVLGRVSAGAGVVEEISTTGSGNVVRATSPTLVTPDLGVATATSINSTTIPASKTLVVTTDKLNVLSSTTSAELAGVISDETGTGSLVFGTSPTLTTPNIGTATGTSLNVTNSLTAGAVTNQVVLGTTNTTTINSTAPAASRVYTLPDFGANGIIPIGTAGNSISLTTIAATNVTLPTSGTLATTGNLSQFASTTSAQLAALISDETGTAGSVVFSNSPTLVTPALGTPSSATLTNATGLPVSTGISGLGSGVATMLATPSSANIAAAVTDETGTGLLVFGTAPTFATNVTIGTTGTATGAINLNGLTSGTATLTVPALAGTPTITLPTLTGTLATLAGNEALTNKTINGLNPTALATGFSIAGGTTSKTLTVSNSLTLAGIDGTTMTFPASSASVARTDAAQTFIGVQTFSSLPTFSALTLGSIPFAGTGGLISQDNANLFWDSGNKWLGIGTAVPSAPLTVVGDVNINANGSTTGSPRTVGIIGVPAWVAGNAARYTFGDPQNSLQNAYGDRMQLTAYWGVDISGNTQTSGGRSFVVGAGTDASLNVIGTTTTAPVLTVTAAASQTGNMQEWRNSGGTALASVGSGGNMTTSGSITSSGTAGVGYATGAGGTITQITNKSTTVTLNKISGQITMNNASLAANSMVTFQVTNSTVGSTDVPVVAISSGETADTYLISVVEVGSGYFKITIRNNTGTPRTDALVLNFAIIKAVSN